MSWKNYALAPLSWLYSFGWRCYQLTYSLGLKRPKRPHSPVICIGNLRVGGTGKTPFVRYLASELTLRGYRIVISMSGYGSPRSQEASIPPNGELSAAEWGDEPALMRQYLPEIPLIVGRNRVAAANLCAEKFPDAVLLLDDGFQHLPLHKDFCILLDPPIANHFCLPAGPYRQPATDAHRADLELFSSCEVFPPVMRFLSSAGDEITPCEVQTLTAIGEPNRFNQMVEKEGFRVLNTQVLRDHAPLSSPEIMSRFKRSIPILVTTKDWIKLKTNPWISDWKWIIADYEFSLSEKSKDWLFEQVEEQLKQVNSSG